jgi:hypothetical protein
MLMLRFCTNETFTFMFSYVVTQNLCNLKVIPHINNVYYIVRYTLKGQRIRIVC